jgi:hypothetical protein
MLQKIIFKFMEIQKYKIIGREFIHQLYFYFLHLQYYFLFKTNTFKFTFFKKIYMEI